MRSSVYFAAHLMLLTFSFVGCGSETGKKKADIQERENDQPSSQSSTDNPQSSLGTSHANVERKPNPDSENGKLDTAIKTAQIDATSNDPAIWTYFDLDAGQILVGPAANGSETWDLKFQRTRIASNGGITSPTGSVSGMIINDAFTTIVKAPSGDYVMDASDSDDPDTDQDTIIARENGWYLYDMATHKLTPKGRVYIIKSNSNKYYKLRILTYYSSVGTPAIYTIEWAAIEAVQSV